MPEQVYGSTEEWLAYAKRDLDSASFLTSMRPIPIEIICYHCQQSAEKTLKAFMIKNNIIVIKTHDLGILLEKCSSVSADFKNIMIECSRLTDFATHFRYPFRMEVEESDMRVALSDAQKIWDFVQKKLGE